MSSEPTRPDAELLRDIDFEGVAECRAAAHRLLAERDALVVERDALRTALAHSDLTVEFVVPEYFAAMLEDHGEVGCVAYMREDGIGPFAGVARIIRNAAGESAVRHD